MPVNADRDAVADLVLGRVGHRQAEALLRRLLQDRERDRVMKPPLRRRGKAEDFQRIETVGGDHPSDLRPLARQCAGLVEEYRIDLAEQVESAPVLDEDPLLSAERQCRQHPQRCRHSNARAEITVQRRYRALRADRCPGNCTDGQGRDHRLVGELLAPVLRGELVAGSVIEDLGDFRGRGIAARFLDRDLDLACYHDGRCKDAVADAFFGRRRLAGQRMLVDHRHALDDDAVDRHHLAGVGDDDVALLQPVERHLDLDSVLYQPDETRLFAKSSEQELLRAVLGAAHQKPPERQAPGERMAPGNT